MIEGIPRISVKIITYKQEDVIRRTIESLLSQKDYLYEICVSDDCSPDSTCTGLQEYDKQYPGLFKLYRNEVNLGIFANFEKAWELPTGDLVYHVSGDDECGKDWFKRIVSFIQENNIDYKNDSFCIYGNYMAKYPNGDSVIIRNNAIENAAVQPFSLAIRHVISNRSTCFSTKILRQFQKVSQGRSHLCEEILERQLQILSPKNYYIDHLGNIYHVGIGVSAHMGKKIDPKIHEERQQLADYTIQKAAELGYAVSEKDKNYLFFTRSLFHAKYTGRLADYYKALVFYFKGYNSKIGLRGLRFKRVLFALRRRMSHKTPISMTV